MPSTTADVSSPTSTHGLPANQPAHFKRLIEDIRNVLGPESGITGSQKVQWEIQDILEKYHSSEEGWHEYAFRDASVPFTRNLVDKGNGKYNLVGACSYRSQSQGIDWLANSWWSYGLQEARA